MPRRTYDLADAYFALDGNESLSAVAHVLREELATPAFMEALANRLAARRSPGDKSDFQLVLAKRKMGQALDIAETVAKRAHDLDTRLKVRERMQQARENGEDIKQVAADLMQATGRKRSWIFEVAGMSSPQKT